MKNGPMDNIKMMNFPEELKPPPFWMLMQVRPGHGDITDCERKAAHDLEVVVDWEVGVGVYESEVDALRVASRMMELRPELRLFVICSNDSDWQARAALAGALDL